MHCCLGHFRVFMHSSLIHFIIYHSVVFPLSKPKATTTALPNIIRKAMKVVKNIWKTTPNNASKNYWASQGEHNNRTCSCCWFLKMMRKKKQEPKLKSVANTKAIIFSFPVQELTKVSITNGICGLVLQHIKSPGNNNNTTKLCTSWRRLKGAVEVNG